MTLADHSAAPVNAAFNYQFERALFWLSKSPAGARIGVETSDDVAICGPSPLLEQDKHTIAEGEPFGDRSKDLWNALAIWTEALTAKEIADTTQFLMVTNAVLPDCIAKKIGVAKSEADIDACVTALELAGKDPPKSIVPLVNQVLIPSSRLNLRKVILQAELADGSQATAGPELRANTIANLQLPNWCIPAADSIVDELLGWLHASALAAWQSRQPAWIDRNYFVDKLHAIIDRRRRQISRERAENLIPIPDEQIGQEKDNKYVKQLYLITDEDDIVDIAIRDFIRCNIEKGRLSVEGNITDEDWTSFESALLSRWARIRARVIQMRKQSPEQDIGFEIYTETAEDYRENLAGSPTEQVYLTSGTYHRLADSIQIGWHPRFKELMQQYLKKQ